jgi:hypothetical protein
MGEYSIARQMVRWGVRVSREKDSSSCARARVMMMMMEKKKSAKKGRNSEPAG